MRFKITILNGTLPIYVALSLMSIIYELTHEASFEEISEQISDLASHNIEALIAEVPPADSKQATTTKRFCIIFAVVTGFHLILLAGVQFDFGVTIKPASLKLRLLPQIVVEQQSTTPVDPPLEQLIATLVETPTEAPIQTLIETPIDAMLEQPLTELEQQPSSRLAAKPRIRAWISEAKALLPNITDSTTPSYKTFSTQDFPNQGDNENGDGASKYYRAEAIQTIVTRKSTQVVQGSDGKPLIKTNDGFGNITCVQERGPVSTFEQINPTLWYRVPLSTCGHVK